MASKAPIRTCIACGTSADKRLFGRIVRTPEGEVCCDASGKLAGRGAYLCLNQDCFDKARSKRLLDARLRIKLDEHDYDRLATEYRALCDAARAVE